jgi:phospholipid transport system substrate-binding protein
MSLLRTVAVALVIALVGPVPARAADPAADRIQTFYNSLLDMMKRGPQLGMQGRYHAIEPAVDATFDVPAMIQFIVGPTWSAMKPGDQTALIAAFGRMTVASYAANFSSYSGEQFNVDPNVQQRGQDKFVQTTLVPKGEKPVPLMYRMRQSSAGGNWKVVDVFLNGYVSTLSMRRSDFAATLASGGAPALIAKINQISDGLLSGGAKPSQ